ncbi:ATP-binding protein [Streptacidiphilus fuscans]|uniref:Tetratricopeptide repeat protein n=1 Tax=Streptacidiphilus fuscans TaxID=2789292 RepID=A0A931B658_9ACTN|nr:tetratricopeptide repeat protein [Streptacidiphilus fuscans]MBF9070963.1 tetratricopeptide repeat protein [Streptacidiphilus fuscans]
MSTNDFSGSAVNAVQADTVHNLTFIGAPANEPLPVPRQIPRPISDFRDRVTFQVELDALLGGADGRPSTGVVIVSGMGGVGKTSLAVHWMHRVAESFPHGHLYANLRGFSKGRPATAHEVLDQFLRALDVPESKIPADEESRAALFRTWTSDRSFLVLLDNASSAEQVRALIPSSPRALTLITSRNQLSGLAAESGARRIRLRPFDNEDAVALLTAGTDAAGPSEVALAARLAQSCGHLPLTLRIVQSRIGARADLPFSTAAEEIAEELLGPRPSLHAFSPFDGDSSTEVHMVFAASYDDLPADLARTFRLLGLHPGEDFGVSDAAALSALEQREAARQLNRLVQLSLLEESDRARFRFHDLLRSFAAEHVEQDEVGPATERLLNFYLAHTDAADRALAPGRRHVLDDPEVSATFASYEDALAWCELERSNLLAGIRLADERGEDALCWRTAMALITFLHLRGYDDQWIDMCEVALRAARRLGDRWGEAWCLMSLGGAYREAGRLDSAAELDRLAADLWRELGDAEGEGKSLNNLGSVLLDQGRIDEASPVIAEALRIRRPRGGRELPISLIQLGRLQLLRDEVDLAEESFQEAMGLAHSADRINVADTHEGLGHVALRRGRLDAARSAFADAASGFQASGASPAQARALRELARCLRDLGRSTESLEAFQQAHHLLEQLSDPTAADVLQEIEELSSGA